MMQTIIDLFEYPFNPVIHEYKNVVPKSEADSMECNTCKTKRHWKTQTLTKVSLLRRQEKAEFFRRCRSILSQHVPCIHLLIYDSTNQPVCPYNPLLNQLPVKSVASGIKDHYSKHKYVDRMIPAL